MLKRNGAMKTRADEATRAGSWTADAKTDLVLSILAGELTVENAAERHGLPVERVAGWRDLYLAAGRRHGVQRGVWRRGFAPGRRTLIALGCVLVLLGATAVVADPTSVLVCEEDTDLFCFDVGTPARAGEINHNFAQVRKWLEDKVGAVSSPTDVTVTGTTDLGGTLTVDGTATMNGALNVYGNASFGSSVRQMLNLYGTDYALGVQSSTMYFRTNDNFAWFQDGVHSNSALDPGSGGTMLMKLDTATDSLHARCPNGTADFGPWCITTTRRGTATWENAMKDCVDEGMTICSLEVLMACDTVQPSGIGCTADTDADYWFWTTVVDGNDQGAYGIIRVYNGVGNDATNEIDITASNTNRYYYCCTMGPARAF
jgi:hypothetical protein